jgi:hypothetical protein
MDLNNAYVLDNEVEHNVTNIRCLKKISSRLHHGSLARIR